MHKLFLVFTLISALFFAVSCDSGVKFNNPNDQHNADHSDSGDSIVETQDDTTDTAQENDDLDSSDSVDASADTAQDDTDTTDDEDASTLDNSDDDTETNDDTDTENDADKDSSDSNDDTDSNNPDSSDSDNDADTEPTDPCVPNPCFGIENSTEICTVVGNIHTCECKPNYYWDGSACGTTQTQTASCTGLPDNAEWNTASQIIQTWDDHLGTWVPTNTGSYNENQSSNQCRYKCKENYSWETPNCVADTRPAECTGLPDNAEWWNSDLQITQTWDGTEWQPTNQAAFSDTSSPNHCYFKCNENYYWDSSAECINPCNEDSCSGEHMIFDSCTPTGASSYTCGCESGYYWWATETGCTDKRPLTLGNICTEQNKCYNASSSTAVSCSSSLIADFFGQDAQYAAQGKCTPQSFTVQTLSSRNVVYDNNTGLMWQQTIPTEGYSWEYALSYCDGLTYAGYSDWRLPTPQELLTIVDNSRYSPAIDTTYFPDTTNRFWSSSRNVDNPNHAWLVDFGYGDVINLFEIVNYKVRCVRGSTLLTSLFHSSTLNGDVIVTDTETGLIWQKSYVSGKTWQQALSYCETLNYAGYSDWRLPDKNELAALINYGKKQPASDFPDTPYGVFWSSSTYVSSISAWGVSFGYGDVSSYSKTDNHSVRCVR